VISKTDDWNIILSSLVSEGIDVAFESLNKLWELITTKFIISMKDASDGAVILRDGMVKAWDAMKTAVSNAWSSVEPVFEAIRDFASWISGKVFTIDFSIINLPDWMIPGSPIPLHTRMKDFSNFLKTEQMDIPLTVAPTPIPSNNVTNNNYITGIESASVNNGMDMALLDAMITQVIARELA